MTKSGAFLFVVFACLAKLGETFDVKQSNRTPSSHGKTAFSLGRNTDCTAHSRRDVLSGFLSSAAVSSALSPLLVNGDPAFADITNKVASSAAIRLIKRALREIEDLEIVASTDDYEGIKSGLRTPPFTEVRKNCMVLIRGGEDGPDAEELKNAYAVFIKAVEELDSNAGLGVRGRKGISLIGPYDNTVKGLRAFLDVAERSASIPIAQSITETRE